MLHLLLVNPNNQDGFLKEREGNIRMKGQSKGEQKLNCYHLTIKIHVINYLPKKI